MPPPITVAINIVGNLGSSLPRAFSATIAGLKGIQRQAQMTSGVMRGLFGLGTLGAGVAAFAGVKNFLAEGVKLAKEQEVAATRLSIEMRNQAIMRHQSLDLAQKQTAEITKQARVLQRSTGMNQNVFIQGASQLAQTRISAEQIRRLQPLIANLLADQRMKGQGQANYADIYGAVTQAIRGRGQALARLGVHLTDAESRMMKISALTGQFGWSLAIVERKLRELGGSSKAWLQTFEGQMEAAQTRMQWWQVGFGKVWQKVELSIVKLGVVFMDTFGQDILNVFGQFSNWLVKLTSDHSKWIKFIKTVAVPVMQDFRVIWGQIIKAFSWISENGEAVVNIFKALVALWAVAKVIAIGSWFMSLLTPIGLVTAAVVLLALTWKNYYTELVDIWNRTREMIFGSHSFTAPVAAHGLAPGYPSGNSAAAQAYRRSHGWGTAVRSALPIEKGWVQTFLDAIKPIDQAFEKFRIKFWQNWDKGLEQFKTDIGGIFAWLIQHWNSTIDAVKNAWNAFISVWTNTPGGSGNQAPGQSGYPAGGGGSPGTAFMPTGPGYHGVWQPPWVRLPSGRILQSPPPTAAGYSVYEQYPWEDRTSRQGPFENALILGKGIGLGMNVQKQLGVNFGDWVNLGRGGKSLGWRQMNETSSRPWGVEFFTNKRDEWTRGGPVQILKVLRKAEMEKEKAQQTGRSYPADQSSAVHIHNNVTYNLHGSSSDLEHRVASLHRNHIDNLKRDMEEVFHRLARSSFVNRAAWT